MSFLLMWLHVWFAAGMPAQSAFSADTLLRRAAQEGTPLVDSVRDDGRYVLVTFVWRGSADTNNIAVIGTFLKAPIVAMTRIGNSDVWYVTTRVPARARFAYWLAENTPMVSEGPQVGAMLAALQADPLNAHRTCAADAPLKGCKSTVELPGAPAQPWIVKNASTPSGKLDRDSLKSERLNSLRTRIRAAADTARRSSISSAGASG